MQAATSFLCVFAHFVVSYHDDALDRDFVPVI
jgi:hypothetical protein